MLSASSIWAVLKMHAPAPQGLSNVHNLLCTGQTAAFPSPATRICSFATQDVPTRTQLCSSVYHFATLATEWTNIASLPTQSGFLLSPSAKINASWLLFKQVGCSMHQCRQDSNLQCAIHFFWNAYQEPQAHGPAYGRAVSTPHFMENWGHFMEKQGWAQGRTLKRQLLFGQLQKLNNTSWLHSHQKTWHLHIKFWLPSKAPEKKQAMPLCLRENPHIVVKTKQPEKEVVRELLERSSDEWEADSLWECFGEL